MSPQFLICGLEHTGTTLISDLFRQIPHLDSGFECGALLRDKPKDFVDLNPFAKTMLNGWGITQDQFEHCCSAEDFDEFYERLQKAATVLAPGTTHIFDKTPRYLSQLGTVLGLSRCPVLVSFKDPRAIVCSDFKRSKSANFDEWYDQYRKPKLQYVTTCYEQFATHESNERVHTVGLEDLAMNSRNEMESMFRHVGEQFQMSYAIIDSMRYKNVRNKTVSADIVFEYKGILSDANQDRILSDFSHCERWIYN